MPWDDAALGHLRKCATAGEKEFALAVVLEGLAPGGVGVHMMEDHDVAVAEAEDEREMTCLIRVHCVLQINDPDEGAVGAGPLTGTVMLRGFVSLVAPGASMV